MNMTKFAFIEQDRVVLYADMNGTNGYEKINGGVFVFNLPEGYMCPWLNFGIVEFDNGVRATGQIGFDDGIESGMDLVATVGVVKEKVIKYKETVVEPQYGFIFQKA